MKRHLIVEGCDATGKDTLIDLIMQHQPFPWTVQVHPRASTSLGGPVSQLSRWVDDDLVDNAWDVTKYWLYNRHPLISEPIYGPHRQVNPGTRPFFNDRIWLGQRRRIMASRSVLVICQPPFNVVSALMDAQGAGAHMPGVYENRRILWDKYAHLVWPGHTIRYDWTSDTFPALVESITKAMESKKNG
jgi:hypothetical protein